MYIVRSLMTIKFSSYEHLKIKQNFTNPHVHVVLVRKVTSENSFLSHFYASKIIIYLLVLARNSKAVHL